MRLQEYDTSTRVEASVASSARITPTTTDEVREIVLTLPAGEASAPFATLTAGQTVGVLAPGEEAFGQEHHFRLYTIAELPKTLPDGSMQVVLCVRRCNYIDEYSGERYEGRASNYLCNLRPGDNVTLAGPYGIPFPIPEEKNANLLLIGMGTGIAPFRAFVRRLYEHAGTGGFEGKVLLFHGGLTGLDLLYRNDERDDFALYYDRPTFEAISALSADPVWDEHVDWATALEARAAEVAAMLRQPETYVYLAGLEPIRDQLDEVFASILHSEERWQRRRAELEAGGRWVELLY